PCPHHQAPGSTTILIGASPPVVAFRLTKMFFTRAGLWTCSLLKQRKWELPPRAAVYGWWTKMEIPFRCQMIGKRLNCGAWPKDQTVAGLCMPAVQLA